MISKQPIKDILVFKSKVDQAIAENITPPVIGLTLHKLSSSKKGYGYLAIMVPQSESRPHLSRNKSSYGFFFRTGHRSIVIELFQIRDQMLRRSIAQLSITWDIRRTAKKENTSRHDLSIPIAIDLIIINILSVSARFPYLFVTFDRGRYASMGLMYQKYCMNGLFIEPAHSFQINRKASSKFLLQQISEISGGSDCCIHPSQEMLAATINFDAAALYINSSGHLAEISDVCQIDYRRFLDIILDVSIGSFDAPPQPVSMLINGASIQKNYLRLVDQVSLLSD